MSSWGKHCKNKKGLKKFLTNKELRRAIKPRVVDDVDRSFSLPPVVTNRRTRDLIPDVDSVLRFRK